MNNLKSLDLGIIVLRTTIGITFIFHSIPKIVGGIDQLMWLGEQFQFLGIHFAPALFGFLATLAEFLGDLFLTLGTMQRLSSLALLFVMIVAVIFQVENRAGFNGWSHPLKMIFVFLCLAISSKPPGLFYFIHHLAKKRSHWSLRQHNVIKPKSFNYV